MHIKNSNEAFSLVRSQVEANFMNIANMTVNTLGNKSKAIKNENFS